MVTSHTHSGGCFFCFSALPPSKSWLLFLWLSPQSHTMVSIILSITQPDGKKEGREGGGRRGGKKEGAEAIVRRDMYLIFYQK